MLTHNGYNYTRHSIGGKKIRWICTSHYSKKCKATVYTIDEKIVRTYKDHVHPPNY
ncbi:hypothetical protein RR46_03797 [Papilio xuthus]|uniref:FLYWCH-type domain-containing protein n=1 Tax=Papilio xuthus TaxID=66420 RepID=A0A194Q1H5_PAPXU|nr:hypothetical protein RR46_03797 [Papilio xuthus]